MRSHHLSRATLFRNEKLHKKTHHKCGYVTQMRTGGTVATATLMPVLVLVLLLPVMLCVSSAAQTLLTLKTLTLTLALVKLPCFCYWLDDDESK